MSLPPIPKSDWYKNVEGLVQVAYTKRQLTEYGQACYQEGRDSNDALLSMALQALDGPCPCCITEQEKKAFAFGWWKALEVNRKEWSGLTTGEIVGLTDHIRLEDLGCFILVARVIESKLKEKNYD